MLVSSSALMVSVYGVELVMRLELPCKCPAQPHGISVHGVELVMRLELPCKCQAQPLWCLCSWYRTGYETKVTL